MAINNQEAEMKRQLWVRTLVLGAVLALVAAACGDGDDTGTTTPVGELKKVRLQLQWVPQSQFAGYFAAKDQGFYAAEGLEVEIIPGGVDIAPQQVVAQGGAEFGLAWVPKVLKSNEEGTGLVNIAQVFQRSGTLEVSWKDSNITSPDDLAGKKVGNWGYGNEFELLAALVKAGLNPTSDVTLVAQNFDMNALLNREIDAAEAMTYNEYAQVLEAINPDTGALYQPSDLNVINFNDVGTAMLQDAVWVQKTWLDESANRDIAEKFLRASFKGWIYCRDNFDGCVDIVMKNGPALPRGHMNWQLNEINKLIWPSPDGIGVMDSDLWKQTIEVATSQKVLASDPGADAYRTDIAEDALKALEDDGLDIKGAGFAAKTITLTEGGK